MSFGTSGHRGSPLKGSFNEMHIIATTQAICDYRRAQGITGPLLVGRDTHAASEPAQRTALEVLAANDVETIIQSGDEFTPTPAISRAILVHNRDRKDRLADGIVITPSHNPPEDGDFKYNPPNGGPADSNVTNWIQSRANELLRGNNRAVKRMSLADAQRAPTFHEQDFLTAYVDDLRHVPWRPQSEHGGGGFRWCPPPHAHRPAAPPRRQTARMLSSLGQPLISAAAGPQRLPRPPRPWNATSRRFGNGKPRPRAPGLL